MSLLALLLLGVPALAGPPFVTDDPEPVELGHHELYLSSQVVASSDSTIASLPLVEFNYGVARNLQLHAVAPAAYSRQSGGPAQYGYGDTEVGAKYRILQETASSPMAGVFPLVEIPTGSAAKGLGNGNAQYFFPLWLQKSEGAWSTYGGGGWWLNPAGRNFWRLGWQVQRKLSDALFLGVEVFHNTRSSDATPALTGANLGGQLDLRDRLHLLFSGGHSLGTNRQTFGYLGILFD